MQHLKTYALTATLALLLGCSYLLDGPHELDVAQATANAVTALPEQHAAMQVTR